MLRFFNKSTRAILVSLCSFLLLEGCAEDWEPQTGYTDPCSTPMAGPLGCPFTPQSPASTATYFDACKKLVECGILSADFLGKRGEKCFDNLECGSGACLAPDNGEQRCYFHYLDYHWCTARLSSPGADPCEKEKFFSSGHLASAIFCIMSTPCNALGLPFALKLDPKKMALDEHQDVYMCQNGKLYVATATTCEQGILQYWSEGIN